MPGVYDDIFPVMESQGRVIDPSPYADIQPPPILGHQLPRWDRRRTGGPPSLSDWVKTFGREMAAQASNVDRGANQLFNMLPIGDEAERQRIAEQLAAEQAAQDERLAEGREQNPMAAGLGQGAMYAMMPQQALPSIVAGALYEGLKYAPDLLSRAGNAGLGAFTGGLSAMGSGIGRSIVQPGSAGPNATGLANAAGRLNVPLTAGQRSMDPRTLAYEDYLRRTVWGGMPFEEVNRAQQSGVNRAMGSAIGAPAGTETINQAVVDTAFKTAGDAIEDIASRNVLKKTPQTFSDILSFRAKLATDAKADVQRVANSQFNKFTEALLAHGGKIPGKVYRELNTGLNGLIKNTGDPDVKYWVGEVQGIMRKAMGRSLTDADREAWALANRHYSNLKRLTNRSYVFNPTSGDVNAKNWASVLEQEGTKQQRGRMPDPEGAIADFGRGMPSHAVGSQTAGRLFWDELAGNPLRATMGIPTQYLPARLLARGGLLNLPRPLARSVSPTLGYLGKTGLPGVTLGLLGQ